MPRASSLYAAAVGGRIYVYYPSAAIRAEGVTLCTRPASHEARPKAGDRLLVFALQPPEDSGHVFVYPQASRHLVFQTASGDLLVPQHLKRSLASFNDLDVLNDACRYDRECQMRNAKCRIALSAFVAAFCILHSAFGQFQPALPGYDYEFPRDHGTHNEYKTEWWYYTGHLRADDGHRYGFELTFFRVGVSTEEQTNAWELRHLALAHFAVTDIDGRDFRYYEKLNRMTPFTANAVEGKLDVFNEGWRATTLPDGSWRIRARAGRDALDLVLRTQKPPAIHGENGVSVKSTGFNGSASHYYSMTRLEASGSINGKRCSGQAWMDHEFGSAQLRESQRGWDWFSIQLDNETELMVYLIRRSDGTPDVASSGSLIGSDGNVIHLRHDQVVVRPSGSWTSSKSKAKYPMGWRIEVPSMHIALTLDPLLKDQELLTKGSTGVTYWEGAVDVSGSSGNTPVRGEGYVEMTGYDRAFKAP